MTVSLGSGWVTRRHMVWVIALRRLRHSTFSGATRAGWVAVDGALDPDKQPDLERLPAARGLVPRRPLFDRLSAAGPGEVILVCAPAGSGKTVLLRSWVEAEGLADRVAWVSVGRGERDAQRFWLSVIDELAGAVGEDGLVERVGATPAFDGQAVVERLLSDLRLARRQPVVLVIDDLHELRSAEALALLERFLTALPPALRVVLATREDPGLGLHRLRLAGGLTEIRGPDLRFSLEETRAAAGGERDRAVGRGVGAAA